MPIDSEHFSIHKLLEFQKMESVKKIFITASGGPFLDFPKKKFDKIKMKQAVNHPNWRMGRKITIDCTNY